MTHAHAVHYVIAAMPVGNRSTVRAYAADAVDSPGTNHGICDCTVYVVAAKAVIARTANTKWNFPLRYNVAPTDQITIVRIDPRDGEREVVMARWGLIPFWMKEKPKVPHINARAETVHKMPLFREGFAKRRCLIPATGFYEWQKREDGKQPYRFRRKDLEPFAFAGVWEFARLGGGDILSTAIIVGEANPLVGAVHDRMPVMLMSEDYDRWLGPTREPHVYAAPWRTFFLGDLIPNRSD